MRYASQPYRRKQKRRWPKLMAIALAAFIALAAAGAFAARQMYLDGLEPVNAASRQSITVDIKRGASLDDIAKQLKDAGLIRSEWVFKFYVARKNAGGSLQAGNYTFSPSQSVEQLLAQLTHGKVQTDLVTIVPGQSLQKIRAALINYGFSEDEVDSALNPALHSSHPALRSLPPGASLEGYLYPDSYQRDSSTTARNIVSAALDQMHEKMTTSLRKSFAKQGLNAHEAVILASVVEREVPSAEDRAQVAQVFLKRLEIGMALQSDATRGFFDTYANPGLPPSPISNVSASSLEAVANPANTDWLYFVSGDDGTTHFSKTLSEHEANIIKYCTELCGR